MPTPFQVGRNTDYQLKSDLKLLFNLTLWWSRFAFVDKFIILCWNVLPGHTTQHACCSCPISDNKSLFLHDLLFVHCPISLCKWCNFSSGKHSFSFNVSIWIPRKVMRSAGPSVLSSTIGTPSLEHHSKASCSASSHCDVPGAPNSKKSSRLCKTRCAPFFCKINCRVSATAVKIFGADRSPKESAS